jgi:hypothetical protein
MRALINQKTADKVIELLLVALVMFVGYIVFTNNTPSAINYNNSDIHRGFERGISVLNGVNPYLEFNPNQMLDQEKVPGFFPLYFYFMAALVKLSDSSFVKFLDTLRVVVFFAYLLIGLTLYRLMRSKGRLLAFTLTVIFMFNRWTLNDALDLKQDTYVILLLLVSLINLKKRPALAMLLYGVATGIKHLTIFAAPIYVFELVNLARATKGGYKKSILYLLLMLAPIALPAIPFILATPKHFAYALMYNVTRTPETSGLSLNTGFDKLLVLNNQDRFNSPVFYALPRLPLVVVCCLIVLVYFARRLSVWQYCFMIYLAFIAFNPVLFSQYYVWMLTFLPLAVINGACRLIPEEHQTVGQ